MHARQPVTRKITIFGGCYIFSYGQGLAVIGETQNANAMDEPGAFYSFFRSGLSLGESFLKWIKEGVHADFHRDRTILGDPTLRRQAEYLSLTRQHRLLLPTL